MELFFLGTSGATPTKDRNLISTALRLDSGEIILFDAGEDVQRRFQQANLRFNVPTIILISHLHGDHIIGLPGLLFNFHLNNRTQPLLIIGPPGLAPYLISQYQYIGLKAPNYNLQLWEIEPLTEKVRDQNGEDENDPKDEKKNEEQVVMQLADQLNLSLKLRIIKYDHFLKPEYNRSTSLHTSFEIYDNKEFSLVCSPLNHSVLNLGFKFVEKPRNGKFNPERATELRIPKSKWSSLQQGRHVLLKDGRNIKPVELGIVTVLPANVINFVLQHRRSFNTHTKCIA